MEQDFILDDVTVIDERSFDGQRVPDPMELPTHKQIALVEEAVQIGPSMTALPTRTLAMAGAAVAVGDILSIVVTMALTPKLGGWAIAAIVLTPLLGLAAAVLLVRKEPLNELFERLLRRPTIGRRRRSNLARI